VQGGNISLEGEIARMANGTAALRLVSPEPAAATSEGIEQRVGTAMADAVAAISLGCVEWLGDGLTAPTKSLGGERIAALYWLLQEASGFDFEAMARVECRRVLRERHGPDTSETTNVLIDGVFEILAKVSTHMRLTAN